MDKVIGSGRASAVSFTRPADTNVYAAGDVVGGTGSPAPILTFARVTKGAGGFSMLRQAVITSSAAQATKLEADLLLFDVTVVMDADNAAFTPTDAEMLTCVGRVKFLATDWSAGDATAGAGGNAVADVQSLGIVVTPTLTENALFGVLVARNGYTPVSGEVFKILLKFVD